MKTNQKSQTSPFGPRISAPSPQPSALNPQPKTRHLISILCLVAFCSGCQVLTYTSPTGETFTRSSLGSSTAIRSLCVENWTNGTRRIELRGYQNDSIQALGVVTEAAVRAALQSATPLP